MRNRGQEGNTRDGGRRKKDGGMPANKLASQTTEPGLLLCRRGRDEERTGERVREGYKS